MPGKFINEITGDTPAKDDLAVFFDKSKNSTAQATIAEIVNAGLDLAAGAKGQVPTIDVKVDAATSSLVNILTWGAGGGVDFKGTPTRPPTGTDEILTNDPANGLIGKTTLQQLVVAGGATILQPGTAVNTALVWNDTAGKWEPARAVSEAKNINGGAAGELPFQLNTHVTAWIPLGNAGQVLTIGDIGTAGNSFIAPMWNDPVKELPTFTIADKGKQLTVKADGKATEWVEDAKELPAMTVADAAKPLAVKADGTGAEWATKLNLLEVDAPPVTGAIGNSVTIKAGNGEGGDFAGGNFVIALGMPSGTKVKERGCMFVKQHEFDEASATGYGRVTDCLDHPAISTVGPIYSDSGKVNYGMQIFGVNAYAGHGCGYGIIFGAPGWTPGLVNIAKAKTARLYAEFDHSNSKRSRLIFQTAGSASGPGDIGVYSEPMVLWSNGAMSVGISTIGILVPPYEDGEIYAKGPVSSEAGFKPPSLADTAAANNRIYFSTTANKLVFKDSAGVVHPLYS